MKKGFTLIELLGVIVILAIIALIASPIVLNIIKEVKTKSIETSIKNLENAAQLYYYNNKLDGNFPGITFQCNGKKCQSNAEQLKVTGKVPEIGTIKIDKDGKITLSSILMDGYSCTKNKKTYKCTKAIKTQITSEDSIIKIEDSKTTNLFNFKIYGNSYQETRSGKNLFNIDNLTDNTYITNNGDGTITVSHYPSSSQKLNVLCPELKVGDVVTFSMKTQGYDIIYLSVPQITWTSGKSKTITEDMLESYVYFYTALDDKTTPVTVSNIQFEKGTKATAYEPYGLMPSPQFPSEVMSVGDYDEVSGKYKIPLSIGSSLDYLTYKEGYYIDANNIETAMGAYKHTNEYISVLPNTEYKLVFDEGAISGAYVTIPCYDKDKNFITRLAGLDNFMTLPKIVTFTTPNDCYYIKMSIPDQDYKIEFSKVTNIYLDEPLNCVNGSCDYIDFEKGVIERQTKKFNFSEYSAIDYYSYRLGQSSSYVWQTSIVSLRFKNKKIGYNTSISNYFSNTGNAIPFTKGKEVNGIYTDYPELPNIYFDLGTDGSLYSESNPIKNWEGFSKAYIITQLEKEQEPQKIELPEIKINEGVTNITIDTSIKPSKVELEYYK